MTGTRKITLLGAFAAIVFAATFLIRIPTSLGYFNAGDGTILLCASLLGEVGAVSAVIGATLADLVSGYALYIPVTAIIKGIMALVSGILLKRTHTSAQRLAVLAGCELFMVLGYFIFESILYSAPTAALAATTNLVQATVGTVVAELLIRLCKRLPIA